jgi:L-threonylcarbamoyladenylate synthase
MLLRSGSVSIEELQDVVPETIIYQITPDESPRSPGVRHKHYSPRAEIVIVEDVFALTQRENSAYIGLIPLSPPFVHERVCSTVDEYAHSLFEFFRECDRAGVKTIYCESVDAYGIGAALMDRLRRASEK